MKDFPDIPPVWALAAAVSSWILAVFIPVFHVQIPILVSILTIGSGFAIAGWSAIWFLRKKTTIEPRHVPTSLIVEGPFRINRNPIYTGMALVLLGFAFWLGAISAIVPVLIFPVVITRRFIKDEEAQLGKVFGNAADEYFAKSRRW
ncbi:MAG: isoprenylcysteine carboxylmethyltransferase family protein [Rhodobacteraceae bacterium]|nr:isoprenylcysteine carboxylmethyltransferase family protein [Paracoccaceae bacterium]